MKYLHLLFLQACFVSVFVSASEEKCKSACECPSSLTLISSPNRKSVGENNCDAEFSKVEWQNQPIVSYPGSKSDKTYTLLCVDPDPPGYHEGQYWLHWLVSNIKGEDFAKGDLSKAKHLKGYKGPAPPQGSGLHRYMFLAFEEGKSDPELEIPENRGKFELDSWLQKHSDSISGPIAAVQFKTQY